MFAPSPSLILLIFINYVNKVNKVNNKGKPYQL